MDAAGRMITFKLPLCVRVCKVCARGLKGEQECAEKTVSLSMETMTRCKLSMQHKLIIKLVQCENLLKVPCKYATSAPLDDSDAPV